MSIIDIDFKFGYAAVLCVAAKSFHCNSLRLKHKDQVDHQENCNKKLTLKDLLRLELSQDKSKVSKI